MPVRDDSTTPDIDAIVTRLQELTAEVGASPGEDAVPELLTAEQAIQNASERVALLGAAGENKDRLSLLREAVEALAEASRCVEQWRALGMRREAD